jgi:hypothetical protein
VKHTGAVVPGDGIGKEAMPDGDGIGANTRCRRTCKCAILCFPSLVFQLIRTAQAATLECSTTRTTG